MRRDATSEFSLLMALAIEWCVSSHGRLPTVLYAQNSGQYRLDMTPHTYTRLNEMSFNSSAVNAARPEGHGVPPRCNRGHCMSKSCLDWEPCTSQSWQLSILFRILSLAVRSAIDVGGWQIALRWLQKRPPRSTLRHVLCTQDMRVESMQYLQNRIAKHSLCDVGPVGDTGIPTHVFVADVFQFAECEQTTTPIARMRMIDLSFHDPEREEEELVADRAAAHILTKQHTA